VLGFGGDVSDMQYLDRLLTALDIRENYGAEGEDAGGAEDDDDGDGAAAHLSARNVHRYLSKVMYKRRSDFDPLWNQILVAGLDSADAPFLASVDLLGTTFSSPSLATGFGAHLAQPILRKLVPTEESTKDLSRQQAVDVVRECMKVLFYRDARSLDRYSLAVVTKEKGVELSTEEKLEGQSWAFADRIRGYGTQVN